MKQIAHEHAAARADDAERHDLRRGRPRAGGARDDDGGQPTPDKRIDLGVPAGAVAHAAARKSGRCCSRRLERLKKQYAADKDAAAKLLTVGESKRDEKLDAGRARRVHRRVSDDPEPGRSADEGITYISPLLDDQTCETPMHVNADEPADRQPPSHHPPRTSSAKTATGIGTAALASLLPQRLRRRRRATPRDRATRIIGGLAGLPHFAPKAKRVIYLFQNGAPSHVDLFDYKPKLQEVARQGDPRRGRQGGKRFSTMTGGQTAKPVLAARSRSSPSTARAARGSATSCRTRPTIADELCFVKSMHTERGQPRPGDHVLPHRRRAARPAEHGRVADLRPGQRRTRTCRRSS